MGTIGQKFTYLNETKKELKQSINNIGGSIDNETTFREYADELETIYNSMPKVTNEGTSVTLTPTKKGKLGIVEKGNSTQESTTGKNLLKNLETAQTVNGITFTPNADGTITLNGTATANALVTLYGEWSGTTIYQALNSSKTYTLSGASDTGIQIFIRTTNGSTISSHSLEANPTFTGQTGIVNYFIQVLSGTSLNNVVIKPQLEEGSSVTSYEPYTRWNTSTKPNFSRAY